MEIVDKEHIEALMFRVKTLNETIEMLEDQIQMMWQGFEEGISVDEMNKRIFPEALEEE
jgi:hypothetical protein